MTGNLIRVRRNSSQSGYAILTVIFLATLMVLSVMIAAPRINKEGQRQKELDMIWRGKQYARGVKLYYRKMGRFPTSLDDLTKPKIGSIRFMRQAYKDPMNTEDGSWRLLYVGPAGQLMGSHKAPRTNVLGSLQPGFGAPTPPANGVNSLSGPGANPTQGPGGINSGFGSNQSGNTPPGTTGAAGTTQGNSTDSGLLGSGMGTSSFGSGTLIGGNIIGVGSKAKSPSIIIYDHAKNYWEYEFIWDPSKDSMAGGQPGNRIGSPIGTPIGQPIGGQTPGTNPMNPPQSPPLTPQQQPN
jgi:hypothetical protein